MLSNLSMTMHFWNYLFFRTYFSAENTMLKIEGWGILTIIFPVSTKTFKITMGPQKIIYYPQVYRMAKKNLEAFINNAIVNEVHKMIGLNSGDTMTPLVEMIGTYELKNNQRNVLSLTLSNYSYYYNAAHGMTNITSLTFDLEKGRLCELKDLFKPGSNYVDTISKLIHDQIKQRNIMLINDFTVIRPNQYFYIADKTLVIYFQLYELTPYVFGFPMFPISVYDIQDIIDEDGPLGRMAINN